MHQSETHATQASNFNYWEREQSSAKETLKNGAINEFIRVSVFFKDQGGDNVIFTLNPQAFDDGKNCITIKALADSVGLDQVDIRVVPPFILIPSYK